VQRRWTAATVLRRSWEILRADGVGVFWFKLLGETVYRRMVLVEMPLDGPIPALEARGDFSYRFLGEQDVADYLRLRPDHSREEVERRLREGHRCFAAAGDDGLVAAAWLAVGRAHVEHLRRELVLEPHEVYVYDGYADPGVRGLGIAGAMAARALPVLAAEGFTRAFGLVVPENRRSIESLGRLPFRVSAQLGSIGAGRWRWQVTRRVP
jgi:ribosomal protein S18 acetylase RimI-like enzyme